MKIVLVLGQLSDCLTPPPPGTTPLRKEVGKQMAKYVYDR